MRCTEILKARVSPELKRQVKALADRDLPTEAAWIKRLAIRAIYTAGGPGCAIALDEVGASCKAARRPRGGSRRVYVRLCREDWLLLDARAAARGMRRATYLSVLTRSHLRSLTPLPKEELLALKHSTAELAAIGRNINQIAHAANGGWPIPGSTMVELRTMLKVCEALRANTKALLKANLTSWAVGHDE